MQCEANVGAFTAELQAEQIKLKEKAQLKNTDTILTLFITKIGRIATLEYLKNTRIATRK